MKENQNIDELLNSFVDGELSPRQQVEVQRLIANDADAAKKLCQLQKCRQLVGALPFEEAPAQIAMDIKASLERKTLLGAGHTDIDERRGALHLFMRKFVAAAAMFLLVVALGAVVYVIVSPPNAKHKKVAADKWMKPANTKMVVQKSNVKLAKTTKPAPATQPVAKAVKPTAPAPQRVVAVAAKPVEKPVAKPVEKVVAKATEPQIPFSGKMELKVRDVAAVDAAISRAMEDNGLLAQTGPVVANRKSYSFNCSEESLKSFLGQLKGVWSRFDSTRLVVDNGVAVDNVTIDQISKITDVDNQQERAVTAKNFAVLNSMDERLPGKEAMAAVSDKQADLANIPKPVLTSKEKAKEVAANENSKKINLTIVITPAN